MKLGIIKFQICNIYRTHIIDIIIKILIRMMAVKISSWLIRSDGFGFYVFVFVFFFFLTFKKILASTLNTTLLVSF